MQQFGLQPTEKNLREAAADNSMTRESQVHAFVATMLQHTNDGLLEYYAGEVAAPTPVREAYIAEMLPTLNANCAL
jgi:hypothetical protein